MALLCSAEESVNACECVFGQSYCVWWWCGGTAAQQRYADDDSDDQRTHQQQQQQQITVPPPAAAVNCPHGLNLYFQSSVVYLHDKKTFFS